MRQQTSSLRLKTDYRCRLRETHAATPGLKELGSGGKQPPRLRRRGMENGTASAVLNSHARSDSPRKESVPLGNMITFDPHVSIKAVRGRDASLGSRITFCHGMFFTVRYYMRPISIPPRWKTTAVSKSSHTVVRFNIPPHFGIFGSLWCPVFLTSVAVPL